MPILSLSNNICSESQPLALNVLLNASFSGGTEGFSATNADLTYSPAKRLGIQATATNGYAYQNFSVIPGVPYSISFKWHLTGGGTQSAGNLKLGSTDGGHEYMNLNYADDDATYQSGDIDFTATASTLYLRLITATDTKYTHWDNIIIKLAQE